MTGNAVQEEDDRWRRVSTGDRDAALQQVQWCTWPAECEHDTLSHWIYTAPTFWLR